MAECQRCGSKSQLFLCNGCTNRTRQHLKELPWWLNRLQETATGQTRMSDNGGRRSARRNGLHGDMQIAECIEPFPNEREDDLEKARKQREKAALAHALAAGGINARATDLLTEIADSLHYWTRQLCETTGTPIPTFTRNTPGLPHALWLTENINAIAAFEYAIDIVADIDTHIEDIEKMVNRPIPVLFLGKCPTWDDETQTACGMELRAKADMVEINCRKCRHTHNVGRLQLMLMNDLAKEKLTIKRILELNRLVPEAYRVSERSIRRWRQHEKLKPHGHNTDGEPLYLYADVRKLKAGEQLPA